MIYRLLILIVALNSVNSYSQFDEKRFSLGINGIYTTTAKIYLSPNSSNQILRNSFFPIEHIYNYGADLRYRLSDKIVVSLNAEYMKAENPGPNLHAFVGTSSVTLNIIDGFILIPVELSLFYLLPFSTQKFKFLMGGGGGMYIGEHLRHFGDAQVSPVSHNLAFGIQVGLSVDYLFLPNLSVRTEMKFRDPQFTATSRYHSREVVYNNSTITLAQDQFESKINVDGISFSAGLAFHF
jgi:hypothetical protein